MRPTEKKIHQLIQNLSDKTRPELDEKILGDCFAELDTQKSSVSPLRPGIWRIVMKITKPIAAAIVILAGVFSLTFLDTTVAPAYAIEQTVEAFKGVYNLRIIISDGPAGVETFMLINRQTGMADHIRMDHRGTGDVTITVPGQSYVFSKQKNEVMLLGEELLRNDLNFRDVINSLIELTHAADGGIRIVNAFHELTQQKVIAVTLIRKDESVAGEFLIDPESRLPMFIGTEADGRLNYMGPIEYNVEIAENAFKFIIPEDATVIDNRPAALKTPKPQAAAPFRFDLSETAKAVRIAHNGYAEWVDRKGRRMKTWARLNPDTGMIDVMRLEYEDGGVYIVGNGKICFEDDGIRGIQEGQTIQSGLLFNNFVIAAAQRLQDTDQMRIEKRFSEEFEREVIVVDVKQPWMELQAIVDVDSKLPVKFSIPWTQDVTERLHYTERIAYNIEMPDGIFDFKTDPNTIILGKQLDTQYANDPKYGIPYDNDEDIQDVCQRVAAKYLQAKIDGDIRTAMHLHSISIGRYGSSKLVEFLNPDFMTVGPNGRIVEIQHVGQPYEYKRPAWRQVPCRILISRNGQEEERRVGVLVYLREHDGQKSAAIIGFFPMLQEPQ